MVHTVGGPCLVCSQLSPMAYRGTPPTETREVSVHLAHIKTYYPRDIPPAPDVEMLDAFFLGRPILTPTLDHPNEAQPQIKSYIVDRVVGHKKGGPGPKSPHNNICRIRFQGYGPESDLEYRAHEVPQGHEIIAAYRTSRGLEIATSRKITPSHPLGKRKRNDGTERANN